MHQLTSRKTDQHDTLNTIKTKTSDMSSYPSQDPKNQSGYDDYVPESMMTQEELEEAKQSYRAGLQQRIGQLERDLSDRKHSKDGKKGSKSHSGSSSKSSKKSSRHKYASSSSASGSAMPTYPVSYSQSGYAGYDDGSGGGQSSSQAAGAYTDGSGQQWVWSSSQGWVRAQDQGASSAK